MFKIIRNELKCTVPSFNVRIPGEGLDDWEVAVLQCFDTKAASRVILQALYAQTFLFISLRLFAVNVCALILRFFLFSCEA